MECRISVKVQNLRLCGTCFRCVRIQLDPMVEGGLLGICFLRLLASIESDGARKACAATFFQRQETYQ